MQCAAWSPQRLAVLAARPRSRVGADRYRLTVGQRAQHEEEGRGTVHQPLGLAPPMPVVSGTPGMLGSRDSVGQHVGLGLCRTSTALEPPELPRDYRAGRDAAVEEEGRGGAWRGDVLPRWRRESEETVPPGWPSIKGKIPF